MVTASLSASLPAAMVQAIIDHARADYPNEACGVIVGDKPAVNGGTALRWVPTRNEAASPYRYRVHADDLLRLTIATDEADQVFWAIVHSHVGSPAVPSSTDLGAAQYPDALYILVSLADDTPALRAWQIIDGAMDEVELLVA